ncbi:MAG: thiamine phosphate synthase [Pyrinomonadaceae bacterium]
MKLSLPQIYPITDVGISGLAHNAQARALAGAGCRFLQIRDKQATSRELYEEVLRSIGEMRPVGGKVIVNDRVDIAMAAGADGVHLGQSDLSPADARKLMGEAAIIGFSAHSVEQARRALALPIDYLAIGPIFDTRTKADPDPTVGVEMIRQVRLAIGEMPLVAIGGINSGDLQDVLEAGADSAAIISGLAGASAGIGARFQELAELTNIVKQL